MSHLVGSFDHGVQLPMFLNPKEIMEETYEEHWTSGDRFLYYSLEDMWETKREEGWQSNQDLPPIRTWKIFQPVTVMLERDYVPTIGNGHHRILFSAEAGMQFIPVVWSYDATFSSPNGDHAGWVEEHEAF